MSVTKESRVPLACFYKNHRSIFYVVIQQGHILTLDSQAVDARFTMQGCGLPMVPINVQLVNGQLLI